VPAETPRDIIEKFHREAVNVQFPNVKERLEMLRMEPMALSPADFHTQVRATTGVLAKAAGLKPNPMIKAKYDYLLTDPGQFDILQSSPGWEDRM
jgi:hypothetical protein